jgi:DNA polymerase III subunit beta
MNIICTQENLKAGLTQVGRIVSGSNTLPILNNVLLKTEEGQLTLATTNLELAVSTKIRCKIEQEGSLSVSVKTLTDLVNNLPNTNIVLKYDGNEVHLSTDHYNTKIKALPSDEFPLIPTIENGKKLELSPIELKTSLDQVVFAASTSETQPEISGVLLKQEKGQIRLVATDRYRLAEKTTSVAGAGEEKNIIIPNKTAQELSRIITNQTDPVTLVVTENQISASVKETSLISRLIDGQYPDYQQIIPQEFTTTVTVEKQEIVNALRTSGIFSRATGSVVLKYNIDQQQVVISATSHDVGESVVEVAAEVTGEAGSIILNYRYVLDALTAMPAETVVIKIVNESAPVIFVPQGDTSYIYLVMPIKT